MTSPTGTHNLPASTKSPTRPTPNLCFFAATPKGGETKTAQLTIVITSLMLAGWKFHLSEFDPVCPMRRLYGDGVESHPASPDVEKLFADPALAMEFFAPLLEKLYNKKVTNVVDLGSPIVEPLIRVMRIAKFGNTIGNGGAHLRPIIPTSTDQTSVDAAWTTYKSMREIFPLARIALAISERQGPSSSIQTSRLYTAVAGDAHAKIVVIPKCPSPLFASLYGIARIPPHQLLTLESKDIEGLPSISLSRFTLPGHLETLQEWIWQILDRFGDYLPNRAKNAA